MKIAHISDFHLRHHIEGDNIKCGPDLISEGARSYCRACSRFGRCDG